MVKDPVCGMKIEEGKASGKVILAEKVYFFCSKNCKEKFEREPQKYLGEARGGCH